MTQFSESTDSFNIRSAAPDNLEPKFDITAVMDGAFHIYASQIAENYLRILRKHVLSNMELPRSMGLRELRVLNCIFRFKSGLVSSEIVDVLRYDPATVSRAITRLEKLGYCTKKVSHMDARATMVKLTQSGEALAGEYRGKALQIYEHFGELVGVDISEEDIESFLKVAKIIRDRTDKMERISPTRSRKHLEQHGQDYENVLKMTSY